MAEISQNFFKGKMNKDLDERFLEEGEYFHAENIRVVSPAEGNIGVVKNIQSTIERLSYTNFVNLRCLSHAVDEINNKIYLFFSDNTDKDFIIEYDTLTNTNVIVLESFYPNSILNFGKKSFAKGIVIDGNLIWSDGTNPPRMINIEKAKNIASNRLTNEYINLIKKPPAKEPSLLINYGTFANSEYSDKFFKFAYRFIYNDGTKSSVSFFSETVGRIPDTYTYTSSPPFQFYINSVIVSIDTGEWNVSEIEILAKDINSPNIYICKTLNKEDLNILGTSVYSIEIKSPKKGAVLSEQESLKLFDNVPLRASEVTVADSRIFFGNYTDGYDFKRNGTIIKSDVSLVSKEEYVFGGQLNTEYIPLSLMSDTLYEYGLVYYDEYNRSSTTLTWLNNSIKTRGFGEAVASQFRTEISINHLAPDWAKKFKVVRRAYEHNNYPLNDVFIYPFGNLFYLYLKKENEDKGFNDADKIKIGDTIEVHKQIQMNPVSLINPSTRINAKVVSTFLTHTGLTPSQNILEAYVCEIVKGSSLGFNPFVANPNGFYDNVYLEVRGTSIEKTNFYETSETFSISSEGHHLLSNQESGQNQTISTPFKITLNDGDSFIDGIGRFMTRRGYEINGEEFDSIDVLRANNSSSTSGKQDRYASIIYSGKYSQENGVNDLNSFNLASGNYEDFDKKNGAVIKLHPREGDMMVFQEDGINKILLAKDALYGGDGKATISVIENVLGQKIEYPYRNGISKNRDSFDYDGTVMFFADDKRGVICAMEQDGVIEISNTGMSGWFKQLFKSNPNSRIHGVYDKSNEEYVISIETGSGTYTLGFSKNTKGWVSFYSFNPKQLININNKLFSILVEPNESNTLSVVKLYEHDNTLTKGNLHGKNVVSKITTHFNEEPFTAKVAKTIELDCTHPCEIKLSVEDKYTTIYENEFVEKEDSFVAYVRRNENTDDKSGKQLKGLSNFVSLNNKTITVTLQVDSSLIRIGDTLCKYNTTDGVVNIGVIESYTGNTITVNAVNTTLSNGDFILSKRNLREEGSAIRGDVFKAEVTMPTTNSTVELSSITLGVSKSFV